MGNHRVFARTQFLVKAFLDQRLSCLQSLDRRQMSCDPLRRRPTQIAQGKLAQLRFDPVEPPGLCVRELVRHLARQLLEAFRTRRLIPLTQHLRKRAQIEFDE